MLIKCTLNRVWLAIFLLAILSWRAEAEIGFKHIPAWERMIDPIRQPPEMGFMSVLWDSLSVDTLEQDTTLSNISEINSALSDSGVTQPDSTYLPDIDPNKLPGIDPTATGALIDPLIDKGSEASSSDPDKSHISDKEKKRRDQYSPEEEEPEDEEDPPEYHPTIVKRSDYPVEYKAVIDTSTNFVVVRPRIGGSELPFSGAIDPDTYIQRSIERSDWESWRKSVLNKFPKKSEKERGAIEIFIPVIKGKLARRIFGGPNIGLSVTGDISINGGLKTENREQLQRDNQSNTNVAFKMDQTQRFHITGSVGEKVEVSIDQDSERLFEFENNLRISYKGNPDEIIQSIEAGNVSLTLPRTRLISGSARHQGLFGLKITSQVGPLKLTTIASLDKGEKKSKNIEGGAESQRKKIDPRDFIQNKYFFLDDIYRENYRRLNSKNLSHFAIDSLNQIVDWRVYKSISAGETQASTRGWAHANPDDPDTSETTQEHQVGLFTLLTERIDYTINTQTGWIRLNQQWLNAKDILAVSYLDGYGIWHGELREGGEELSLKLIRPESPKPDDSTWELMWRHVYSLGATGIDWEGFSGRIEGIIGKDGERKTQETYAFVDGALNFIDYRLFGLDYLGASGEAANPDGMIDQAFLNLPLGELHFPDLRPFDPEGWYFDNSFTLIGTKLRDEDSTLFSPAIYDEPSSYRSKIVSDFDIIVEYENVSASYNLGFLVLEGSEEVILNGRRLTRGADYTMDYKSSELVILDPEATAAGADLEIKWETGSLVSLDSKTILGIRAEYGLWDDSYIGTTIMYRSQKTQDRRIRVGSEPVKNSIWDINAALVFRPDFLTRTIDWLPLIETNKESKFTIEGEVAQIYPNPNSLNSPSTGDNNGVAYVDDFESIKRSLPLGITRKRWNHASFPEYDMRGEFLWAKKRGRIIWYNPIGREPVKDIWPEKEVQATDSKTDVLKVEFQPYWDEWGADNPGDDQIQRNHWGGIMRYLGAGFADQTQSKYIEIWLNRGSITSGEMYIDLGHITEDVIPNFVLDTEDMPEVGFLYGDNILDSGEDIGFDGIAGNDGGEAQDSVDINGDGILYPSYDDYEERNDSKINGTEGNRNINNYPDTEDLDGDKYLDQTNSFFRYKIDFTEGDNNRYIAGGLSNTKGWRLYRIPLVDTMSIGDASLDAIEYARLWFTGFKQKGSIRIAQIDIVGNEWLEDAVGPSGKETEPIKVAVINTHDNPPPEYIPPPGVSGELDPVTNQRAKEQSLVLKIDKLNTGETGSISKRIQKGIDLLDYKFLKLFVHGGNYTEQLTDRMGRELNLDMFFRFGDNDKNYYEYSQRLFPGWSPHNEIIIDMERLSSIKFLREQDSLRNYDILPNGDVIRVVGNPTLGKLRFLVFGVKNHGRPITAADNIEIWVDELRVSDVHRNPGWAARGSVSLNLADLIDVSASMDQKDANFHGVDKKLSPVGSSQSLTGNMDIKIHLDKFFNPQWGLRLPLSGHFNQKIKIPKFKPNSDILLSALGGEQVSAFSIFSETLTSNSRFSNNPVYTSPSDSLISLSKRYSINTSLSKSKKSDNIFVHYTMDQFSLDGIEHSETYSSDERYLYKKEIRNKATMTYKFPIDDPIKLNWLGWTRNLPFMHRYSESLLQPLPRSLTVNARGEEYDQIKKTRNEKVKPPLYTFKISRSYNLSWQPLSILGMNFGQTFAGEQHRDELRRTEIARNQVDIDSTQYFVINPDDSSATFDSTAYADAVEQELSRVKDEIYWKLGGLYFIDRSMNQNFSTNFRPEILSWLNTDANYSSRYTWGWSETFGPGDRSVSTSSSFSTSLTFRLQSLMRAWDDKAKDKLESSGKPGNRPPDEGIYDNIPPPDNPFDELDRYNDPIPDPGSLSPEVLIGEESKDSIEVAGDSLVVKKPRPHPLAPLKFVLRRLKDIRYQYSLSNNPRNNSMEPGQARWKYRLGITTDPGLDHVAGWEIRDSNSRQDRHTISSGFDITQNLRLSTISYNVNKAENITFYSGRSGSNSSTAWHYFQDGDSAPKSFPILNYSASWSGLSQLEFVKRFANSINVTNSFSGNKSETWQFRRIDSVRTVNTISYDKSFSPLLGMSFNWEKGISSTMGYNFSQRVEENHSMNSKTRNVNESMTFQTNYTSRKGFRIPIPVWPFKNRRFKNSTSFAIHYQFSRDRRETSNNDEDFSDPSTSTSWSVSPSIDYSFSSTVKGGFDYEYGVRRTQQQGKVKSQEFSFRVNISIRG